MTTTDKKPEAYDQLPICPRCGSDWPCCADINPKTGRLYLHEATCDQYNWSDNVCESCRAQMNAKPVNQTSAESVPLLLNNARLNREKPKSCWRFFQCTTGKICVAWTIPLVLATIGMLVATGLVFKLVATTSHSDNYRIAMIPMVMITVVMTCIAFYPWFELIRTNKARIAREQEARNP